jgi:Xaa-Pro aminopeptidase
VLTEKGCRDRRSRLWEALPASLEWVLLSHPRHLLYFAGFQVDPLSLAAGERGFLWLERSGTAVLVCDNMARRSAVSPPFVDEELIATWYDGVHSVATRERILIASLGSLGERMGERRGAVDMVEVPTVVAAGLGATPDAEEIDLPGVIAKLRRRKEPDEVDLLRKSVAAGEAGHRRARSIIRPGITELDVYREVQSAAVQEAGRQALVYGDFRATRPTRPRAGGAASTEPLQQGDLFILDYSVVLSGYRADFTNTLAVGKAPTAEQKQLFALCVAAIEAGERALRPGADCADVFRAVSAVFEKAGTPPLSDHAGHGLGLGHPEAPTFTSASEDTLVSGDVVTLEPGQYVDGVGGVRVEHNYLITDRGFERLTGHELALI